MIEKILFKHCEAIRIENEFLKVIILPSLGGKVASFFLKEKNFELLYQNKEPLYKLPKLYDDFGKYDASGFDDAFPTINESTVQVGENQVLYPDHGEIWSSNFKYDIQGDKLQLQYESKILPYQYTKTFMLSGNDLIIDYEIINKGKDEFPCIWTMHCLMICEEDMQLIFPKDSKDILNVLESNFLGEAGRVHSYPITTSIQGTPYALNKVLPSSSNNMEKYYVRGAVSEGICGAYYPSKDVTYKLYYDKDKLPYLGFWVTEGGFRGDYNCALEPSNGYYDSIDIAKREKKLPVLKPNEIFEFTLKLELK